MSCDVIENRILDYLENHLPSAQRDEVASHLAGCARCSTLARQLQQLDTALSARVKAPTLPPGFERRLLEQIQAAPALLSEAQREERKRCLQAEFEEGMGRIVRGAFGLQTLLNHLAQPLLGVLCGWLAWSLTPPLIVHLHGQSVWGIAPNLLPWLAASAACLAGGLPWDFPQRWKSLSAW